ncbi:MAG: RNA 2',3'-cyclic phosphodiesterase [Candidatus Neomarinimicrobiota bacterium]
MAAERLLRTFLGVELPNRVKSTAIHLQTTVEAKAKVVKWIKAANIHFTLRFIGATPPEEASNIKRAVAKAVEGHHDFSLEVRDTGVFPKKERPRVLWLGIGGEVEKLKALVEDINANLKKLGYPPENREYSPHVTIGRVRYPQKVTPDVSLFINSEYDPIDFSVQKVKFFQSDLVPGGPIYSVLGIFELTPTK